jgi:hypothetical protein
MKGVAAALIAWMEQNSSMIAAVQLLAVAVLLVVCYKRWVVFGGWSSTVNHLQAQNAEMRQMMLRTYQIDEKIKAMEKAHADAQFWTDDDGTVLHRLPAAPGITTVLAALPDVTPDLSSQRAATGAAVRPCVPDRAISLKGTIGRPASA